MTRFRCFANDLPFGPHFPTWGDAHAHLVGLHGRFALGQWGFDVRAVRVGGAG